MRMMMVASQKHSAGCKETRRVVLFPYVDFFHGFLYRKRQEKRHQIAVPYNCKTNGRFLYRPVLDFRITLEARNPARRCLRQDRVEAGTDLFGLWVVEISSGRIGTAGRSRCYVLRDEE